MIKPCTWSCHEIGRQEKFTVRKVVKIPLKGWKGLNTWEEPKQIKILLRNKLRADWSHYCADDKIEKNLLVRHVACMGVGIGVYKVLVEKREGKRPQGKSWRIIIVLIILIIIILLKWIFRKWDLPSQDKPSQNANSGRSFARNTSRRPTVC